MGKKTKKKPDTKKKNSVKELPLQVFLGDIISSRFFNRYKFTIMTVVAMLMFYIAIKYECRTRMETIAKLQTELSIVKSESIREQSRYRSRTRESSMKTLVDSMHLHLHVQDQPPYTLSYDEK